MARMKSGRAGQDSVNSGMKLNRNPVRKESHSARREGGIAPYPLNQQGRNLELYVDHQWGKPGNHYLHHYILLTPSEKKGEDQLC